MLRIYSATPSPPPTCPIFFNPAPNRSTGFFPRRPRAPHPSSSLMAPCLHVLSIFPAPSSVLPRENPSGVSAPYTESVFWSNSPPMGNQKSNLHTFHSFPFSTFSMRLLSPFPSPPYNALCLFIHKSPSPPPAPLQSQVFFSLRSQPALFPFSPPFLFFSLRTCYLYVAVFFRPFHFISLPPFP